MVQSRVEIHLSIAVSSIVVDGFCIILKHHIGLQIFKPLHFHIEVLFQHRFINRSIIKWCSHKEVSRVVLIIMKHSKIALFL